jgi:hypothetical protein
LADYAFSARGVNPIGVSAVIYHVGARNWATIRPVALVFRDPERRRTVLVHIVIVSVVAVVFLVRLTFALHGRPSRTHKR